MNISKKHVATARTLVVALVAGLSLAGCASYKNEFATINSRLDSLDTKVNSAAQSADQANQSAQQANQRLDQIEGRLQRLESQPTTKRQPRG
ncbi:alanine-zipper protein [Stenotrophomonas sp. NPDC077464]|uniref:alanine-zipper protein n=1 Tax=unclassified Stenotrophomonas TaxID=196198 RepID=UPI0028D87B2F|nr:alanine-zipper protein [uncultured Stenotrophomonas sp.]